MADITPKEKQKFLNLLLEQFDYLRKGYIPHATLDLNHLNVDLFDSEDELIGRVYALQLLGDFYNGVYMYHETDQDIEGGCDIREVERVAFSVI